MRRREVQLEPQVVLDPRTYQDLVDEARTRVGRRCPEWTDHNVSDPGMTLIDQFAWMTDVLLYRVNRIPERLHWRLLELLGIRRRPPTAARTMLRFMLAAAPVTEPKVIPAGTEVATVPDDEHRAVVFRTGAKAVVPPIRLAAMMLMRSGTLTEIGVHPGGIARPLADERDAFSVLPSGEDALYLGFATTPERLVLQVHVECTEARGTGIDPYLPPVRWEVPRKDGTWGHAAEVLTEGTGGFNYPIGMTEVALPPGCGQAFVGGKSLFWLRCQVKDRPPPVYRYVSPPRLEAVSVTAIGVLANASHCMAIGPETIGTSDGTPAQSFPVLHAPALKLERGEHVEVSDRDQLFYEAWDPVDSFADSGPEDHVFRFDAATGEVHFGPAIRTEKGWRQHGAVPPKGAKIMMSGYRHGGGSVGNVERGRLKVLRKPIPGVASVVNPRPAHGGNDIEAQDGADVRAAEELTTRYRAVTRSDFEKIAESSPHVARAYCLKPNPGAPIVVQILPAAARPRGPLTHDDLSASPELCGDIATLLDEKCLLGTSVHVTPVALRIVTVAVEIQIGPTSVAQDVEDRVRKALHHYLNPLVGGDLLAAGGARDTEGKGWTWGGDLSEGELRPLVLAVAGVEQIDILRVYETDPATGIPYEPWLAAPLELEPNELIASGAHVAHAVPRGAS